MARRKKVGIRQLKNEASRIVNEVREDDAEYVVTRRGQPVAILRPLTDPESAAESAEKKDAYVEDVMQMIRETAKEVGRLSSGESAASVVSRQRR